MRQVLRHRNARLYIGGQTLSSIGDSALWLAMGIWVKILTGSNSDAGLVFCAFTCGLLLSPACGMVVDRLPRRQLLVAVNLASAALVCLLLLVRGAGQIWLIYLVMFGYGASNSLISAAQTALVAVMIPGDLLGEANTLLQIGAQGTRMFTPLIGAGMLAWIGAQPVVLLDAATFLAAAAATAACRLREQPAPARTSWHTEFTAGVSYIRQTPALRRLLVTFVIALTVFGFLETISFAIVAQGLHRTPPFLGVLIAVIAAGSITGAVVVSAVMARFGERTTIAAGLTCCVASCLLLTIGLLPVVIAGCLLLGAGLMWINVAAVTLLQRRTPAHLIGRVDAALNFAVTIPQALSIAAGAALITVINYRLLLVATSVVTAAAVVYLASEASADQPVPEQSAPQQPATGLAAADHPAAGPA